MSEEIKPSVDESVQEHAEVSSAEAHEQLSVDPVEQEAREQGWVSKEEWVEQGKDPAEHRSAKEFKERGELYKSIHSTKRELKQTQAALDSLARHHQHVYQKAYNEAMQNLKVEKRMAMREGDADALEMIEERMEETKAQHAQDMMQFQREQAMARNAAPSPEFESFVAKNPWYVQDQQLQDEADGIGFVYLKNGGSKEGLAAHVEKVIKQRFPEKFGVKRAAPNAVAGVDRTGNRGRSPSVELNELETKIMNDLVRTGVMTKEQYIKELKGK